jgi:toxin YoeB
MKIIGFTPTAFDHYNYWIQNDKDIHLRIIELIKDVSRYPFKGIGKPEPLKQNFKGYWSRRIRPSTRLQSRKGNYNIHFL